LNRENGGCWIFGRARMIPRRHKNNRLGNGKNNENDKEGVNKEDNQKNNEM
jgi:hypothetical protein